MRGQARPEGLLTLSLCADAVLVERIYFFIGVY